MPFRGLALVPLIVVFLAACSTTPDPPATPIDDNAIVPYSRIGKLALGINEAILLKWMGVPDRTLGETYYYFRNGEQELSIGFDRGKAWYVSTLSPRFATADGIRVGMSELEVRAAWGGPIKTLDLYEIGRLDYCFRNGLQASFDSSRRTVTAIEVNYRCNVGTR